MLRRGLKFIARQVAFVFALLVLLVGSHLVSDERIADQLVEAQQDGDFSEQNWILTRPANLQDKYADCFGATLGLGEDGVVTSALRSPTLGPCTDANPRLDSYAATGDLTSSFDYYRYWHGYTVVTRPALAAFGLAGTRYLLTFLIGAVTLAIAYLATKRIGNLAAGLVVLPLAASTDLLWMASSIPTAVGVICALLGPVLIMTGPKLSELPNPDNDARVMGRVMMAAGLVSFADLLSVTAIGWSLTVLAVVIMLPQQDVANRRSLKLTAAASLAWIVGYLATWAAKWLFVAFDLGFSTVWENVRLRVGFRIDGEHVLVSGGPFRTSQVNFQYWLEQPFANQMLFMAAIVLASSVYVQRQNLRIWGRHFALLSAPALLVLVWYEVVRNHNQIHHWLAYRFWAVLVGIVMFASVQATNLARSKSQVQVDSEDH